MTRVRAVSRALSVLSSIGEARSSYGISLSEISKRVQLNVSTVHRMLAELEQAEFVQRHPITDFYILGPKIVLLGRQSLEQLGLGDSAIVALTELQAATGEGVTMAVRQGPRAVYIHQVESRQVLRAELQVGSFVPLHCTAVGKVLLAYCPPDRIDELVREAGLARYTPATITSLPELKAELERTAERGYSIDNEEFLFGVRCMGAPIRNAMGQVVAAVAVTGPSQRMSDAAMEAHRTHLLACTQRVSRLFAGVV